MSAIIHSDEFAGDLVDELVDTCELDARFQVWFVLADDPQALAFVRRKLASRIAALELIEPGDDVAETLYRRGQGLEPGGVRPVMWLQQATFDETSWRRSLARLNQQRQTLRRVLPSLVVVAGPLALRELAAENAPDFLSIALRRILHGSPSAEIARTSLRWLHLSDFHFTADLSWAQRDALDAMKRWLEEHAREGNRPDLVVVTGDIARSGQPREYEQARRFFRELADVLDIEPEERWFVVPGNHDVDRGRIQHVDEMLLRGILRERHDPGALPRVMEDAEAMRLLGRRLDAFYDFTHRLLGPARGWRPEQPWRVDVPELDGLRVAVLQLNSTWAGGLAGDQGRLLVGERQVRLALEAAEDAHLRIALFHHPLADLAEPDRAMATRLLGSRRGCALVMRGHLHESGAMMISPSHTAEPGGYHELAAGAAYVQDERYTGFQLGEVDLQTGQGSIQLVRYSGRGFWAPDGSSYESAPDGRLSFTLPASWRLAETTAAAREGGSDATLDPSRRRHLIERYRQAARAYHGTVRFAGIAEDAPRPHAPVDILFVHLGLKPWGKKHNSQGHDMRTDELARKLIPGTGDTPGRFVVLGDPGSGKSMLCRYLAVLFAGGGTWPAGVEAPEQAIPLLVPFRAYVARLERAPELSLLDFLIEQARTELSVPVPQGFLAERLEQGNALLLLDGLDEVGRPERRESTRDRVQAFCRAYPRVPVLVTSRIAGYEDAPLDSSPEGGFVSLRLAPFTKRDLDAFIVTWYELQEPTDRDERRRLTGALLDRLYAEPRARELARNPLLATLLALVHDTRKVLPGERVQLYQICVETLLETRPARRGAHFDEIAIERQQVALEDLALAMQTSRTGDGADIGAMPALLDEAGDERDGGGDGSVIASRDAIARVLTAILGLHLHEHEGERGLARRWLRFLERESGILVEQRIGMLGFCHLSLMEYLAARALVRRTGAD